MIFVLVAHIYLSKIQFLLRWNPFQVFRVSHALFCIRSRYLFVYISFVSTAHCRSWHTIVSSLSTSTSPSHSCFHFVLIDYMFRMDLLWTIGTNLPYLHVLVWVLEFTLAAMCPLPAMPDVKKIRFSCKAKSNKSRHIATGSCCDQITSMNCIALYWKCLCVHKFIGHLYISFRVLYFFHL